MSTVNLECSFMFEKVDQLSENLFRSPCFMLGSGSEQYGGSVGSVGSHAPASVTGAVTRRGAG